MSFTPLLDPRSDAALEELAALQRSRAAEFAAEARVLARLEAQTSRDGWQAEAPYDSLLMDIAGTCLIGQRSASDRIDAAVHLVRRLPLLLEELDAGTVGVPQARVLIEETRSLSPAICAEVESRIRTDARTLAPGQLRRRVRALILAVDADEAARRAAAAASDRGVSFRPIEDSQTLLIAKGPAVQLKALELQLDAEARALRAAGDPRTLDQLRFELLCQHSAAGLKVKPLQAIIQVPVATALGLSDEPGHLDGYGPLPAALVRQLLPDAELRKVCVDSRTGRVLATGRAAIPPTGTPEALRQALLAMVDDVTTIDRTPEPQHDPSAVLAREVRLRDPGCDGVGCSMPASRCELDHHEPWPLGPTTSPRGPSAATMPSTPAGPSSPTPTAPATGPAPAAGPTPSPPATDHHRASRPDPDYDRPTASPETTLGSSASRRATAAATGPRTPKPRRTAVGGQAPPRDSPSWNDVLERRPASAP